MHGMHRPQLLAVVRGPADRALHLVRAAREPGRAVPREVGRHRVVGDGCVAIRIGGKITQVNRFRKNMDAADIEPASSHGCQPFLWKIFSDAGDQADASLRQALRLDPTNAVVNLNRGMLLAEMNHQRPPDYHITLEPSLVIRKSSATVRKVK